MSMDNWSGGPQALVTIRVNVDDMQPVTSETLRCFNVPPAKRPPNCHPMEFNIDAPGGVSADQAFANSRGLFHSQIGIPTTFGFERYEAGPHNVRSVYYRRLEDSQTVLYECTIFEDDQGVCRPVGDYAASGAGITFHFPPQMLPQIEEIDLRVRQLVDSFTVGTGQ
ncbi:MAG TPA: hypothetical protein VHX19_09110 [Stellaceae bacterium]|nr:hypothetical protein [Stellaceae bacterium]